MINVKILKHSYISNFNSSFKRPLQDNKRVYIKTLNHPQLIDYNIIHDCTTIKNPICIVDINNDKYIIIHNSIFIKAGICDITIPHIILELQDASVIDPIQLLIPPTKYYLVSSIIKWVKFVREVSWNDNKQITKIKFTYPDIC